VTSPGPTTGFLPAEADVVTFTPEDNTAAANARFEATVDLAKTALESDGA
jgi:hypothetical protein